MTASYIGIPGAEVLRKENNLGRARAYDNHAAKAIARELLRKRQSEAVLAELGMEPLQPMRKLVKEVR